MPPTALWLLTFLTFVLYASPDALFFTDFSVMLMELALFVGCLAVPGIRVLVDSGRGLSLGLLIGWTAGVNGFAVGTLLLFYLLEVLMP